MYHAYSTLAQCNWVLSNCFFIGLAIRIRWRMRCRCEEFSGIINQSNVSKRFNDVGDTYIGDVGEASYMIAFVRERDIMSKNKGLIFFEECDVG
jgi:hypothetical protein